MKIMGRDAFERLHEQARNRDRLRLNHNMHPKLEDPVQRLFNAMQPYSYVQPHRHLGDDAWESFLLVEGEGVALTFEEDGRVRARAELSMSGDRLVEIPSGCFHAVLATQKNTLFFEIKRGPYEPSRAKDFASWAPSEGEESSRAFWTWMSKAQPGDRYY